jgi:hypothetical protein
MMADKIGKREAEELASDIVRAEYVSGCVVVAFMRYATAILAPSVPTWTAARRSAQLAFDGLAGEIVRGPLAALEPKAMTLLSGDMERLALRANAELAAIARKS